MGTLLTLVVRLSQTCSNIIVSLFNHALILVSHWFSAQFVFFGSRFGQSQPQSGSTFTSFNPAPPQPTVSCQLAGM